MQQYPGLGLPLRHNLQGEGHYPIGAHGSCYGSQSDLVLIRELAMMSVMESLTDKEDWHTKVFDDKIVSKWREEALAIPDEQFFKLATSGKSQFWEESGNVRLQDEDLYGVKVLQGIIDTNTFDCVCIISM
jgi:hypothetical protein